MKDLVLFGIQGSGKGTQAQILAKKYNLKIIETGGELRKIRQEESQLGQTVQEIIDRGDLVPNEIVMEIVENFLNNISSDDNVLFDGLPRTMVQKETFDALLAKRGRKFKGIFLDVPEEDVIVRMKERGREDDTDEVIAKRIENYKTETLPVIEGYESEGRLDRVNGALEIDDVTKEVVQKIEG